MLVEEAIERTVKGDRAAGLLVMEKRAGAWRFVVVDADGARRRDGRAAPACAACHRDAPRDFVFQWTWPPRPPRRRAVRRYVGAQSMSAATTAPMTATAPTAVATAAATYDARSAGSAAVALEPVAAAQERPRAPAGQARCRRRRRESALRAGPLSPRRRWRRADRRRDPTRWRRGRSAARASSRRARPSGAPRGRAPTRARRARRRAASRAPGCRRPRAERRDAPSSSEHVLDPARAR